MKLLFYIHGITGGGAERVLSSLVNELANRGDYLITLATNTNESFAYSIDNKVKIVNLYENTLNKSPMLKSVQIRRNIRIIAKKENPDIIIVFMSSLGCSVIASTLGLKIPIIISEHTNVSRFLGYAHEIRRRVFYPLANCITVLTRYDLKAWRNKVKNAVYMPNPISFSGSHSSITHRNKVVLAVGRVNQWDIKGFDNMIKCWAVLCKEFPDWKLQIAGDASEDAKRYLELLADALGAVNIDFLGFRTDVNQLMQKSAVFCLSSRVEGLPMALIEAMNAGCCCVSFDVVTGPREIITDNYSGLIAKNQDNDDLIDKLRCVMANDTLRNTLASHAPLSVEKYSINRIVNRWEILFRKILNK